MRNEFEKGLQFTRTERTGMFVLFFLIGVTWATPPIYFRFFYKPPTYDYSEYKKKIAALDITIFPDDYEGDDYEYNNKYPKSNYSNSNYSKKKHKEKKKAVITPFAFNPNTISQADLLVMGIPKYAIDNLVKFRNKGAKFYKKSDFKKVYGITDDIYETVEQFIQLPVNSKKKLKPEKYPELKKEEQVITPFPFDPNTITPAEMKRMGLSEKVISTISNFRDKRGTFRKVEDLAKIYSLKEEVYNKIKPFIEIQEPERPMPEEFASKGESKFVKKKRVIAPIDINKASREEWATLSGIGPGYSKSIVGYREKLGGFYKISQVSETFGLPDSTFQKIKPFLLIEESNTKINLNEVTIKGLSQHPYLNYRQAKAIINYRHNHGDFEATESISKVRALTAVDVERVVPYLRVE